MESSYELEHRRAGPKPRDLPDALTEDLLGRIQTALWIYDFESARIVWANRAGLALWDAKRVEDLAARDMNAEMSASVRLRLKQHSEDFEHSPDREIHEFWTLYPGNKPVRVQATLRRYDTPSGRFAMLVEARPESLEKPETVRSADALLHAQAMIALFDQEGRALYGNPAFRETFGPGERIFGQEFVSPADLLDCVEGMRLNGEHRCTALVHTRTGERWLDIHAVRCRDAVTGDGAFLVTMTDVTTARLHQQELARARDIAEQAVQARSQFLSAVSHEMRTPLNGVLGMASVLGKSHLDFQQRKMLDVIVKSGETMLELVEEILHLVEIDSGAVTVMEEEFEPAILVDSVVEGCRSRIESKGLRVLSFSQIDGSVRYRHDPTRIRQVLKHLVDNAIKFTPEGYVFVRVRLGDDDALNFEVGDTGIGIPPDKIDRVFDRFYQVDGSSCREHGGAGIGLSICHALVSLWGGRFTVQSEPGRGSVFSFTVPAWRAEDEMERSIGRSDRPGGHLRVVLSQPEREDGSKGR